MLPHILKGKRLFSLFCIVLILSTTIFIACYLFMSMGHSLQLYTASNSLQQHFRFVSKGHFHNLMPYASNPLTRELSTSLASLENDDSVLDQNLSMPEISNIDLQLNILSKSSVALTERMGDRAEAMKRSQEYCNIMEHSTFDNGENIPPTFRLSAVVVVVRHGDRSPLYSLPDDHRLLQKLSCNLADDRSNQSQTFLKFISVVESKQSRRVHPDMPWHNSYPKSSKCVAGQLTSRGFLQMINLGKALRRTYIERNNFLQASSNLSSKIYVRATEYVRAFQSAIGFLYGFLSNADFKQVKVDLDSDIYFCSQAVGNFSCNCPASVKLQTAIDQEYRQMDDKDRGEERQIKEKLAAALGTSAGQIPWLAAVLEVLMTHVCHGLNLPCRESSHEKNDCMSWSVLKKLWHFVDGSDQRRRNSATVERFSRLVSYPLLREIVQRLLAVVRNNTEQNSIRIHFFSGHDKTILALIKSLGIYDGRWPPFASNLIVELYDQRQKQFYVRILYNGKDVTRQVRFCREIGNATGGLCPFDSFMYFVFYETSKYFGTSNFEEMCKL